MLSIRKGKIIGKNGKESILKGICLGGWLMMEGYMLGGSNVPEHIFKAKLRELYGEEYPERFSKEFRDSFITKEDIARVKKLGFNCVRLPFNYRLIEENGGLGYLKQVVRMLAGNELYVILDMHAVPGSQNVDWHSDSDGRALFWEDKANRDKYIELWKKISAEFKNEEWIAGYDVMNEPVTDKLEILKDVYRKVIDSIRASGDEHIIFLEGNNWAIDVDVLDTFKGEGIALSAHFYQPIQHTCNWMPEAKYPGEILGVKWDKKRISDLIQAYVDFAKKHEMPLYVGEFGVASRCECCGNEYKWLEDVLDIFKNNGVHWTYWTYKSVKGMRFPDGLFQLSDPSGVLQNHSSVSGMERLFVTLKDRSAEFFGLINTKNYFMNKKLYAILKKQLD